MNEVSRRLPNIRRTAVNLLKRTSLCDSVISVYVLVSGDTLAMSTFFVIEIFSSDVCDMRLPNLRRTAVNLLKGGTLYDFVIFVYGVVSDDALPSSILVGFVDSTSDVFETMT